MNRITAAAIAILILGLMFFYVPPALCQERLTKRILLPAKTIYIDPAYGGKELGPRLSEKEYSKNITLSLALKLQASLVDAGFTVYLSRDKDTFTPLDVRVFRSKSLGADVYLRIKLSSQDKDCIRLFTATKLHRVSEEKPAQEGVTVKSSAELNSELNNILDELRRNSKEEASSELIQSFERSLESINFISCIKTQRVFDYILLNTEMPAITIDLGFSKQPKKPPYILDAEKQAEIVKALAISIKIYSQDHAPSQTP